MDIQLIIEFVKELFVNPYTRGLIIGLTIYIWIVQGIGHLVVKLIKSLFKKKAKSKADAQQGEVNCAETPNLTVPPAEPKRTMKVQNGKQITKEVTDDGHLQLNVKEV